MLVHSDDFKEKRLGTETPWINTKFLSHYFSNVFVHLLIIAAAVNNFSAKKLIGQELLNV